LQRPRPMHSGDASSSGDIVRSAGAPLVHLPPGLGKRERAPSALAHCLRASSGYQPAASGRAAEDDLLGSRSSCTTVTTTDEEAQCAALGAAGAGPPASELLDRRQLQRLVLALRTELECAEARLRAARSEASAAAAAEQNSLDQWQQRVTEADEDAARLRADNLRLEKSLQQASAEERMLAELVQQEPQRAEEVTSRIRAECHRLERQNKRLLLTIAQGRGQLNSLHAEAVRDRLRGQPPPRTQGCAGRLVQRHGSSPVLRGSWQAG